MPAAIQTLARSAAKWQRQTGRRAHPCELRVKRCRAAGLSASRDVVPNFATSRPAAPPTRANSVLSVSRWRIRRLFLAPSEARIISSRSGAPPREPSAASRKFAQAMSSTSPTAPNKISRRRANISYQPFMQRYDVSCCVSFSVSGNCSASRRSTCAISACACVKRYAGLQPPVGMHEMDVAIRRSLGILPPTSTRKHPLVPSAG